MSEVDREEILGQENLGREYDRIAIRSPYGIYKTPYAPKQTVDNTDSRMMRPAMLAFESILRQNFIDEKGLRFDFDLKRERNRTLEKLYENAQSRTR
jgi:hypothetical protein